MRVWGKATRGPEHTIGVPRAAVEGKGPHELLSQAVQTLLASGADRVGAWLESAVKSSSDPGQIDSFRGIVADKESDSTPAEWSRLSPEPPLPQELLVGFQTVEQEIGEPPGGVMIGTLIEMRRALWVPLVLHGHLRGILFAGQRKRQAHLPRTLLESVAAELTLALELYDERRLGRERQQDAHCVRTVLAALAGPAPMGDILTDILQACTLEGANESGPAAVFAAIGRPLESRNMQEVSQAPNHTMCFAWVSGDAAWARALESKPLSEVWQRALESHKVAGIVPGAIVLDERVARVVAFPLYAAGESLGVLVAGLPQTNASVAALERLELRATLATATLLRQKRKEETAERELQQHALLEAVGAFTVRIGADGTVKQLSGADNILFGTRKASPLQPSAADSPEYFVDLFSAKELPSVQAWMRRALLAANSQGITKEVLPDVELRDGTRIRLRALFSTVDAGTAALLTPVPELGETERKGNAFAEVLNVIECLEEGVVLFGPDREIRAINSRFAQIIGLAPEEFAVIKTFDDLIRAIGARTADPANFGESWHSLDRSAEGGVREELYLVRPVPRLLERTARPIQDKAGAPLGRVEIYRDLTAQRVFQSRLLQTEKLAGLGQMVTGIAHELSNPLTSILGYAQRLLLRRDPVGGSHEARQIFQEAERATTILRQLLLSARESRPERRRVALNQVVSRTLELQRFSAAAENIRLQLDLDPVLPFVYGDPGQLQQVLMNLISNSRHAIEEQGKGGTIRVKTKRVAENRVLLEISDDGPGIPQAIQARIFDPFFTTKPVGVGTGLGLAIVLSIVREHGGTLHMTSKPGQNTVFSIEFPATAAVELPLPAMGEPSATGLPFQELPAPESLETAHAGAALAAWAGTRVLVLEDEPTVARLIADVLEDEGLCVDVLLDAREALDRAKSAAYALAICDMKMPDLDGEHFYLALARANNPLHERFLFVTGDVLAAHTRDFLDRYQLPHVAKPFRVEELTGKIRVVLETIPARVPLSAPAAKKNAAKKNVARK
jgi:signal transduction histidine kinase/CheY-like chemotaxis protein